MNNLEKAIQEYLDAQEWRYKHEEDKRRFIFGMKLDNEDVDGCMMVITARDEEDLSCKAVYEFNVPEKKRDLIVEYITRANYGLFLGNFQMDLSDGEVLYQTAGIYYDHKPMQQEVRRLIQVAIHMAERYGQGFFDVMYKGVTPEAAIEAAEREDEDGESAPAVDMSSEEAQGFQKLVSEMTDDQLSTLLSVAQQEQRSRAEARRREEEERRRREEEERRRAEEEAAKKAAPSSLMDKFRRLIGGDDKK